MADNVLRRGLVAEPSDVNPNAAPHIQRASASTYAKSSDLVAIDDFNKAMASSERIETWLVPLWDGVMVGRLLD